MADLAAEASRTLGLGEAEALTVRRAGLLHDLGRLGVSNAVWDRRGKLTQAGAERVRLHPYLTERMLAFSPALAALGPVAVQHHERLDGSGYPRGRSGDAITPAGRILGAADGTPLGRGQRGERMQGTPKTLHGRAVWLAWGAVAGVVVFNLGWLLAGTVQGAGYSVASHDVSDLGALTARFPWVMLASQAIAGTLTSCSQSSRSAPPWRCPAGARRGSVQS